MSLLKDEVTTRLDDLNRAAAEALGSYEDLLGRIEDPELKALLSEHAAAQRTRMEQVADLRRRHGELPQAGDPERSHFEAAGAYLRAAVLPGDTTVRYAESLLGTAGKVSAQLEGALAVDLDPELARLLTDFRATCASFESSLRALLRTRDHADRD